MKKRKSSSNDQGKKQKTSYDNTRKTQIEWVVKLPWAKGVMGERKLWWLTFATFCIVLISQIPFVQMHLNIYISFNTLIGT